MTRQSVTLSRRFLELAGELNDKDRLTCYDKILNHLFNEIPLETQGESDALRITLACLGPELRKAQAQYENGIISKKLPNNSQGFLCHFAGSQQQANNKPTASQPSPYYNNSNIINNNIINQSIPIQKNENCASEQSSSVSQGEICEQKKSNQEEREFYASVLKNNIERLENITLQSKMDTLVERIAATETVFRIKKEEVLPEKVLCKMVDIFRTTDINKIESRLTSVFHDLLNREKVTDKFKYLVSSMYREACDSV